MKKSTKVNVLNCMRGLIGDQSGLDEAIDALQKIVAEMPSKRQPTFDALHDDQLRALERLLAGLTAAVRTRCWAGDFEIRSRTQAIDTLLDRTKTKLDLKMQWRDHVRMADTKDGPVIVAEPYGLSLDDFKDFIAMENAGWHVFINDRVGTYFPGQAVCVILRPPTKK